MQNKISFFSSFLSQITTQRALIAQLIKREIYGRYRGSFIGLLWSFFTPIFMLAIYSFFFSIVYQARWGTVGESKVNFALTLFAGLIPFTLFSECINRSPQLITNNVNYVKKVVFPLNVLPIVSLGAGLFHASVSILVLLIFLLIEQHSLPWTIIFLPLVNLPLIFLILGVSWFLASVGVFVKDIAHTITLFTSALLFLSPIFYSISLLPTTYQHVLKLNPLTTIIEQNRNILLWGKLPDWHSLSVSVLVTFIIAWLGFYWFERTKYAFADVL